MNGYEGIYQVSNLGKIKNKKFNRILKGKKAGRGYCVITLCNNKKHKNKYIHRIVAETFLNNPENFKIVNHKNFNILDNRVDNLEWCSQKYNVKYSFEKNRMPLPPPQEPKKIIRNDGKVFNSLKEASEEMNINSSMICN